MVGFGTESSVSRNMFLVVISSFFFCFLSPAVSQILDLNEGASCEALGGEEGTCQLLTDCFNPGDFKNEHPPICSFVGKVPVICCPISTGIREEDFRFGSNKAAKYCKNHTANCEKQVDNVGSALGLEAKTGRSDANKFMAIIGYGNTPNLIWRCSGTVITSKFILSAASCAEPKDLGAATWARMGGLSLGKNSQEDEWASRIDERIIYPDWAEGSNYNDIALFQLHQEVPFNKWIGPVCLHNGRLVKGDVSAIVWGKPQDNAASPELITSKMVIEDNKKCQALTPVSPLFKKGINEKLMFCASVEDYNPESCPKIPMSCCLSEVKTGTTQPILMRFGPWCAVLSNLKDKVETAGGPILVREKELCLATQIGIASYRKETCGETNYPTIYTRVSSYLPWIEGIIFHVLNM